MIAGRNALFEILAHAPERVLQVYVEQKQQGDARHAEILALLRKHQIATKELQSFELEAMLPGMRHQGFVAKLKPRAQTNFKDFVSAYAEAESGLVLLLDSINDPQNFGTILRAAECFGADGVVYSKNRGCSVTPAVSKASAGASELVELLEVSNLVDAAIKLKESGFWLFAADFTPESTDLTSYEFPAKSAIIMGSEGSGIQPLLLKKVDLVLSIPLYGRLDSLNVSQASAVFMYAYRRLHKAER